MPISMLKYVKTLRHVSISTDHQAVRLYLVRLTELQTYFLMMTC